MEVFTTRPEGEGPFPVVVQLMDGLGMRDELRDHARRTASWGYYVVAPDLYHRSGLKGPLATDRDGMTVVMAAIRDVTDDRATHDVEAALAVADADPAARKGPIGMYGFCMGGRLTVVQCQRFGDRIAAGASLHPGNLVTDRPDSPHRHLDRVRAALYFGIADRDATATPAQMEELERALTAHGIIYQLEFHPDAPHGYMMPSRAGVYNAAAAENARSRLKVLFARRLM